MLNITTKLKNLLMYFKEKICWLIYRIWDAIIRIISLSYSLIKKYTLYIIILLFLYLLIRIYRGGGINALTIFLLGISIFGFGLYFLIVIVGGFSRRLDQFFGRYITEDWEKRIKTVSLLLPFLTIAFTAYSYFSNIETQNTNWLENQKGELNNLRYEINKSMELGNLMKDNPAFILNVSQVIFPTDMLEVVLKDKDISNENLKFTISATLLRARIINGWLENINSINFEILIFLQNTNFTDAHKKNIEDLINQKDGIKDYASQLKMLNCKVLMYIECLNTIKSKEEIKKCDKEKFTMCINC